MKINGVETHASQLKLTIGTNLIKRTSRPILKPNKTHFKGKLKSIIIHKFSKEGALSLINKMIKMKRSLNIIEISMKQM